MVLTFCHARNWAAYAVLGMAITLLGQSASAYPRRHKPGGHQASAAAQTQLLRLGVPTGADVLQADAERIAETLEAKNSYDQSAKGQRDAHEAAKGAKEAARWAGGMFWVAIAETVVTAAGVILVTFTLREAKRTADETKRGADAAAQALELTRRPRIHIRVIPAEISGDDMRVHIVYANRGEDTGYIHRLDCEFFFRNMKTKKWSKAPFLRDIAGDAITIVSVENGAFVERPFEFRLPERALWARVRSGQTELCLIGHVRYQDRRRIVRRTGFMWSWDRLQEEFVPIADDPRWSYED